MAPAGRIEFRDRPISYTELEASVEVAASAFLRAASARTKFGGAVPRQFAGFIPSISSAR